MNYVYTAWPIRRIYQLFIGFTLTLLPSYLSAQQDSTSTKEANPYSQAENDSTAVRETETKGFVPLPLLYYTPDTRLAFGAVGVYYFKLGSKIPGKTTRLSYTQLLADYTLNRQLDIWGLWNIFFREEKYIAKGEFRYRRYTDRFYGIGNTTPVSAEERFQYHFFSVKWLLLRKLKPGIFFGGDYQLTSMYHFEVDPEGQLATGQITGSRGGVNSGVGMVFLMDTRDNIVNASRGVLLEASSYFYGRYVGSDFTFTNINLTYNRYFQLRPRHILATNLVMNLNPGNPPFISMATAGGDDILRGYPAYRYRDNHFVGAQVEYRFPVVWRLGMVLFSGVGDVFSQPSDIRFNSLKYSYGAGLRFAFNRKENINIRLDYGFGRGISSPYFTVREAF